MTLPPKPYSATEILISPLKNNPQKNKPYHKQLHNYSKYRIFS